MDSGRSVGHWPEATTADSLLAAQPNARDETIATSRLRQAIQRTRDWLLAAQKPDGHWVGELEGDTILESEYILLLAWLGRHESRIARKCARYLLEKQLPDGGWSLYPGAEVEISASVKAYFALKLTGHDPASEAMQRARAAILARGGADAVNSFTRFYLALLGQISYDQCPAVPPEFVLLPRWFPVNLYSVSAWTRTILVPLSIISARRPVTQVEPRLGIRELFLRSPRAWAPLRCPGLPGGTHLLSWDRFFRVVDRGWKWCQRHGVLPLRRAALNAARRWMCERFEGSEGLGAIFPPMVWSVIALRSLGYADDSPEMQYCQRHLEGLIIEDAETARLEPCKSPVWDTALAMRALAEAQVEPTSKPLRQAAEWLLDKEIRREGDWSLRVKTEPGGWCFEYANDHYPDLDDTSMVIMALRAQFANGLESAALPDASGSLARATLAIARAERWMQSMQNRDGGWGAFDRDNVREFLCYVPFADHNAMIDPSTPDLSARVLEALGQLGRRVGDPRVDRCIDYLRKTQEADGSWFGRWGVNYIYGTWQVLAGLQQVGVASDDPLVVGAANWLLAYQQPEGGWGESADSYADPRLRGQGPVTASQTAWALLGLLAAGLDQHPAVARGVEFLLGRQLADGTWEEPEFTGTGFPRVFYLRYHLYRIYFPLLALARYARGRGTRATTSHDADARQVLVRS